VSSIKPDHRGDPINGTQEVACSFVVASGDAAVLLELGKEVFDQVPCFVEMAVVLSRLFAVSAALGNNNAFAELA
jgi:hypothetical protein